MIEELLDWELSNKNLRKLAKAVQVVNQEFGMWFEKTITPLPNRGRAHSLNRKIPKLRKQLARLSPRTRFDKLVLQEFDRSLFEQHEYVKCFSFDNYNKAQGVRYFLDWILLPKKEADTSDGVIFDRLCEKVSSSNVRYDEITKREDLMKDILNYEIDPDFEDIMATANILKSKLRKFLRLYTKDLGFITADQAARIEIHHLAQDRKLTMLLLQNLLGKPYIFLREADPFMAAKIFGNKKEEAKTFREGKIRLRDGEILVPPPDDDIKPLVYDLHLTFDDYASFNWIINRMTMNMKRFFFYKDPKTWATKVYLGDIYTTLSHENFHRLQGYFSQGMPDGLSEKAGEYSVSARTMQEGIAMMLEDNFFDWADENREKIGFTKKDLKIARLQRYEYLAEKTVMFLHSLLHREYNVEGKTDRDVHIDLARITGNQAYKDDHLLEDYSFSELVYYVNYIVCLDYAYKMKDDLREWLKNKLGTRRNSTIDQFMKANESIIMQGMLAGNFGFTTKTKWMTCHYMPRAWKHCEK